MENCSQSAGEEDEDTASSSSLVNRDRPVLENELDQFRQQWKQEIASHKLEHHLDGICEAIDPRKQPSIEEQAKYWFYLGIDAERDSHFYQAISYYRRAVQLVPDIEFKIEDVQYENYRRVRQESESSIEESDVLDDEEDLVQRFHRLTVEDSCICQLEHDQRACHISSLPMEILIYIFKWVVTTELDIASLEQLALVSRGFYLCARDEELWKLICINVWGVNCGKPTSYGSWRNMFIHRPHLRFEGCYISKCTYWRHGEAGVDQYYAPVHLVEYYRFVRFFPEGKMLMVTSPEEPSTAVHRLKNWHDLTKIQGINYGYYKVIGDQVTGTLKRRQVEYNKGSRYKRQQRQQQNVGNEQTFHVEFALRNAGKRPNAQLEWTSYSVVTKYRQSDNESSSNFELNNKTYPPLVFSRVKSYTALSEKPLQ